jgi:hypothetical protein
VPLGLAGSPASAAAEKQDHVHLTLRLAVAPSRPVPAGDLLGLYAVEVLACPSEQAAQAAQGPRQHLLSWLDDATDLLMSPARANHRDHFDRPGARIVPLRVPLDRAGRFDLGAVVLPSGRYCQVRLTLTRLPATPAPQAQPALDTSLRLTRPGALAPVATPYPMALELPFAQPWQAGHGTAQLTMTLDPAAARAVLADADLSEGALLRGVVQRWTQSSRLSLSQGR